MSSHMFHTRALHCSGMSMAISHDLCCWYRFLISRRTFEFCSLYVSFGREPGLRFTARCKFVHSLWKKFERAQGFHGWTRGKSHMLNKHEHTSFPGSWGLEITKSSLLTQLAPTFPHMTCRDGLRLFRIVILYAVGQTRGKWSRNNVYYFLGKLDFSSGSTRPFGLRPMFCPTASVYLGVCNAHICA